MFPFSDPNTQTSMNLDENWVISKAQPEFSYTYIQKNMYIQNIHALLLV